MPRPPSSSDSPSSSPFLGPSDKPARRQNFLDKIKSYRPKNSTHEILLIVLLCTLLLVLLAVIFGRSLASIILTTGSSNTKTPTTFIEAEEYQTFSRGADKLWDDLVTPNGGLIVDPNINNGEPYGLAMFHQLHCIGMVRKSFQELYSRLDGGKKDKVFQIDEGHLLHCLDYMRQVALCYADGAVEAGHPMENSEVPYYCGNPEVWYKRSRDLGIPKVGDGI